MNIYWDFDGTLAYRKDGMWTDAIYTVLKNNKIEISKDKISPLLSTGFSWHTPEISHEELFNGKIWWEFYESLFFEVFIKLHIPDETALKFSKEVKKEYINFNKWALFDDTIEILEYSKFKGYKNYILSNHVPELEEIIKNLGIFNYFDHIFNSALIGYEKPNEQIFIWALKNSFKSSKNIMIGDSYSADILGSLNFDMDAVLVRSENKFNFKNYCQNLIELKEFF